MLTAMVAGLPDSILDCASLTCQNMQMTAKELLVLYSRADCHLCELAAGMLESANLDWREVDIDTDPALAARYGIQVPVISRPIDGRELFFPFEESALLNFAAGK